MTTSKNLDRLRIVYMGTPDFAVPTLSALIESRHDVVGVVTNPDRPSGRGKKPKHTPVKARALEAGIEVIQPTRLRKDEEALAQLEAWEADLFVVAAYGSILSKRVLAMPRLGCINVHASLLPKYRGAAPLNWCIVRGETTTGITIMEMEAGLDTGPMLLTQSVEIPELMTAGELHDILCELGGPLLLRTLDGVLDGSIKPEPQDDDQATWAPMMTKADGQIDWTQSATDVANLIRGFNPWPGAYSWHQSTKDDQPQRVKFHLARRLEDVSDAAPGTVIKADGDDLWIASGQGSVVACLTLQAPGKRAMPCRDFLNGWDGEVGDLFVFVEDPKKGGV